MALPSLGLDPILEASDISIGSVTKYIYTIPATNESGEVVVSLSDSTGARSLEILPFDDKRWPVTVKVQKLDFEDSTVVSSIHLAYQVRGFAVA